MEPNTDRQVSSRPKICLAWAGFSTLYMLMGLPGSAVLSDYHTGLYHEGTSVEQAIVIVNRIIMAWFVAPLVAAIVIPFAVRAVRRRWLVAIYLASYGLVLLAPLMLGFDLPGVARSVAAFLQF